MYYISVSMTKRVHVILLDTVWNHVKLLCTNQEYHRKCE